MRNGAATRRAMHVDGAIRFLDLLDHGGSRGGMKVLRIDGNVRVGHAQAGDHLALSLWIERLVLLAWTAQVDDLAVARGLERGDILFARLSAGADRGADFGRSFHWSDSLVCSLRR